MPLMSIQEESCGHRTRRSEALFGTLSPLDRKIKLGRFTYTVIGSWKNREGYVWRAKF
jgi:hypothetical protein